MLRDTLRDLDHNARRLLGLKPDWMFRAVLHTPQSSIDNVLCKLYLPRKVSDPVYVLFLPTQDQSHSLVRSHELRLEGRFNSGAGLVLVNATRIYTNGLCQSHWASGVEESHLVGEPWDLQIEHIRDNSGNPADTIVGGAFNLTPSSLLSPWSMHSPSSTGIRVRGNHGISVRIGSALSVTFKDYFRYEDRGEEAVSFSELAADILGHIKRDSWPASVKSFDDLLLLASFAERHRCVCLGWDLNMINNGLLRCFRRGIVVPATKQRPLHDMLIDRRLFRRFIRRCYRRFEKLTDKESIRGAVYGLLSSHEKGLEDSFLLAFIALEKLLLRFLREKRMEHILNTDEWSDLRRDLRTWIGSQRPLIRNNARVNLIARKLNELNRLPLAEGLSRLLKAYSVDLGDLWPLTGSKSLSTIRNKIVHGENFSDEQQDALFTALQHLHWSVERVLLRLLGWSVDDSNVSSTALPAIRFAYHEWKPAQESF